MSDLVGRTLGHYWIVEQIGAGGMGVVYRACDERLDRDVAIKVLPDAVAQDPERLARFEREAKLLASLSHQNIATLYGLEEHAGERYLVMELVEGETLAERIASGPIPVDDSLEISCQIAEGLEAAHGQGIIHRDLKPANVMLSPEDKVKILDFGLAKAWVNEFSDVDLTHSPTITAEMTASGALMGTAAYMSPEQTRAKRVDKRTDIWAFGCVLYEMLTGHRAFPGEGLSETMAAILKEEPDWGALPPETSATVKRVLGRCLQKDPNRRLHDIADARIAIEDTDDTGDEAPASDAGTRRSPIFRLAVVAGAAFLGLIAGALGARWLASPSPQAPLAVQIETIEPLPEYVGRTKHVAISPDGQHLVYVVGGPLDNHLVHRPLDRFEATPIPGSEGASFPVFSPDGRWVAFSVEGSGEHGAIKKVSLAGGQPIDLCTDCGGSLAWSPDGSHLLAGQGSYLKRVPAAGGEATVVGQSKDGRQYYIRPEYLPGGRAVLLKIVDPQTSESDIGVLNLETDRLEILVSDGTDPAFAESGHLLFARGKELFAVAFDADNLRCIGEPMRVRDDISGGAHAHFDISQNGVLAFVEWSPASWTADDRSLVWVDRAGDSTPATPRRDAFGSLSLSPGCTSAAVAIIEDRAISQIEILEFETMTWSQLTAEGRYKMSPVWSPNGTRIAFSDNVSGRYQVYTMASDFSSDKSTLLFEHLTSAIPSSFSPAGDLVFFERVGIKQVDILRLPAEGDAVLDVVRGPFREWGGAVSPNGAWLAYLSDRSGVMEVYVEPFPDGGPRTQISNGGGSSPLWARGGDELFYLNGAHLIAVPVRTLREFAVTDERKVLFEHNACLSETYDVDCDGQRFLMVQPNSDALAEPRERQRVNLVFNFFDELERLVPTN